MILKPSENICLMRCRYFSKIKKQSLLFTLNIEWLTMQNVGKKLSALWKKFLNSMTIQDQRKGLNGQTKFIN